MVLNKTLQAIIRELSARRRGVHRPDLLLGGGKVARAAASPAGSSEKSLRVRGGGCGASKAVEKRVVPHTVVEEAAVAEAAARLAQPPAQQGTVRVSTKPSECAPDEDAIAKVLENGKVFPDEAGKPHDFDSYHPNKTGAFRGYKDEASQQAWDLGNEAKWETLKTKHGATFGWRLVDFEGDAPDADWFFAYASINGFGVDMSELRPTVLAAQKAMFKEYTAALKVFEAKPGAGAVIALVRLLEEKTGKVAQPGGKAMVIDDLYVGALGALGPLWRFGVDVVAAAGEADVELSWGLKKCQRIWYKLHTKYDYDVSKVTDCARISIVFATADGFYNAARFVLERASTFKNRVANPTDEGYCDLMFTLPMPNGHVCEVQLHLREMMDAKHGGAGHKMYKVCRRVLANPIVEKDTYCHEVVGKELRGEGECNSRGEREGFGTMVYASGDVYSGQWKAGLKVGDGTYSFATGDKYVGQFKADEFDGRGVYSSAIGDRYEGEYQADLREGRGVFSYADGNRYDGEYHASKKHGRATYHFASGTAEVDRWEADSRVGEGALWSADRQTAWRVQDGAAGEAISLEAAAAIAARLGLPVPPRG